MDNRPLNEDFYKNLNKTSGFLKKIYDKTTLYDNYGTSIIIVIIVTLFVFCVFCYCYFMQKKTEIRQHSAASRGGRDEQTQYDGPQTAA